MRPLKLIMQAFGSYGKQTAIDFEQANQNLFLITGDTGAGKTTIFDAMVFALYGEASSGTNKKSGAELQSQFVEPGVQPFVELVFSEGNGESREIYTVRRVPRHVRPLKRGSGMKEESGSVTLLMPDGSEYPQKETDKKLEEIIGLTKNQFMQVAMIAQGEFMELLRARSDDKKVIFRKLFHTELYEKIVAELGNRRKEKQQEIGKIRTVCQTEVSHVVVPEEYPEAEGLLELRDKILNANQLSVTDMEVFLEKMSGLCGELEEQSRRADEEYERTHRFYLEKRDQYTSAEQLLERFQELDQAEKELALCRSQEEQVRKAGEWIRKIRAAYEILPAWERYMDAVRMENDTRRRLASGQEALPQLEKKAKEALGASEKADVQWNLASQDYTKVSERANRALEILKKIREAKANYDSCKAAYEAAEETASAARQRRKDAEEQERDWRSRAEQLGEAQIQFERWQGKARTADELSAELSSAELLWKEADTQKKIVEKAREEYAGASEAYERKDKEYEDIRRIFLNTQAGFIAREQLKPGMPCPVCGSLDHPNPCELKEEHRELSRETLDMLGKETEQLRNAQENAAAKAQAASALLEEKEKSRDEGMNSLRRKLSAYLPEFPQNSTLEQAAEGLNAWKTTLREEGARCKENLRQLRELQEKLQGIEADKIRLKADEEQAEKEAVEKKTASAAAEAEWKSLGGSRDYETEEEANLALKKARDRKDQAEHALQEAKAGAQEARNAEEHAKTLILQWERDLPDQEKECELRKHAYEKLMEEKQLPESEWKVLTEHYTGSDADHLQKKIEEHNRKKAAAAGKRDAAFTAVKGKERPVLEDLRMVRDEAEQKMRAAREKQEQTGADRRTDQNIYDTLHPVMEDRKKRMMEYKRLDDLYNLLAGNVSGSRMDIETYVQRYYLERILHAANRRFQEMSAGQFELRMCDLDRAGTGKNRGLDLMVYSAVTGKEREVRTLSGGESFMAALSLALGMADQIQESAASVHLDVMFIDEGFGSLDDHSRDKAVRVLQDMADGSKLIGIISHVTELKQEIEDQLIVSKDENGSHVRWQIS